MNPGVSLGSSPALIISTVVCAAGVIGGVIYLVVSSRRVGRACDGILAGRRPWLKLNYGFIYLDNRLLAPSVEAYMQKVRHIEEDVTLRNQKLMVRLFA